MQEKAPIGSFETVKAQENSGGAVSLMRCFGREKELRRCMRGIRGGTDASRFLLVRGPSGVGKTNLVVDGLIPWLRQTDGEQFHFEIIKISGGDTLSSIVRECCDALCREYLNFFQKNEQSRRKLEAVRSELVQLSGSAPREAGRRLAGLVREWEADEENGKRIRFLLLIDGFSRLFEERAATGIAPASMLDEAADPFGFFFELEKMDSLVMVVTYRDWVHKFILRGLRQSGVGADGYSGLQLEWPEPEMMEEIVRNAVRVRSQKSGKEWEESLVQALAEDFCRSPKSLSYLLPVLDAIEKEAASMEKSVSLLDYTGLGRLPGFITVYAESLFSASDPHLSPAWAYLFGKFDQQSKQGQRLDHSSIPMPGIDRVEEAQLWRLVSFLTDRRLITMAGGDQMREAMVEPLHPVILSDWDRSRVWQTEYRPILAQVEQFEKQARSWEASQRDARLLLNVESSLNWARKIETRNEDVPLLGPILAEYLELSLEKRKRKARRYRNMGNVITVTGVVAILLMIGFFLAPILGVSENLRKVFGKASFVDNLLLSSEGEMVSAPVSVTPSGSPESSPKPKPSVKKPVAAKPKLAASPPASRAVIPRTTKSGAAPSSAPGKPKKEQLSSWNSRSGSPVRKSLPSGRPAVVKTAPSVPTSRPRLAPVKAAGMPNASAGVPSNANPAEPVPVRASSVAGKISQVAGGESGEVKVDSQEVVVVNEAELGAAAVPGAGPGTVPGMSAAASVSGGMKAANQGGASGAWPVPTQAGTPPEVIPVGGGGPSHPTIAGPVSERIAPSASGASAAGGAAVPVAAPVQLGVNMSSGGEGAPQAVVPDSIQRLAEALAERARKEREGNAVHGAAPAQGIAATSPETTLMAMAPATATGPGRRVSAAVAGMADNHGMAPAVLVGGGATVRPIEEASTSASAGGATPLPREEGPPPERTLKELQDLIARFEQCQRDGDAEGAKSILKGFFEYFVPPEAPGDERKTLPPLVETPQPKREETFRVSHTEFRMLAYTLGDFFNLIGDGRGSDFARRHPAMLPSSEPREISALDRDLRLLLARAAMKAGNPREAVRFFGRRDSPEIMSSEITAIRAALKWVFGEKETAMEGFRFLVEMTPEFSHPETIQALPWSEGARAILTELRREALK